MKKVFRIAVILLISVMAKNAGANTLKVISDKETTLIILTKTALNNNTDNLNSNSIKEPNFVTLPDTTIDIIIISRRIYTGNCGFANKIIQNSKLSDNLNASIASVHNSNCSTEEEDTEYKSYLTSISV
jgi:hypothetical protein